MTIGLLRNATTNQSLKLQKCNDSPDPGRSQSHSSGVNPSSEHGDDTQSSDENSVTSGSEVTQVTSNTSYGSSLSVRSSSSRRDACTIDPSFLELCVNQGENIIALSEIHLRQIQDDGSLFKAIRTAYYQLRGFRRWLFLLKPMDIQYVKVCQARGR